MADDIYKLLGRLHAASEHEFEPHRYGTTAA